MGLSMSSRVNDELVPRLATVLCPEGRGKDAGVPYVNVQLAGDATCRGRIDHWDIVVLLPGHTPPSPASFVQAIKVPALGAQCSNHKDGRANVLTPVTIQRTRLLLPNCKLAMQINFNSTSSADEMCKRFKLRSNIDILIGNNSTKELKREKIFGNAFRVEGKAAMAVWHRPACSNNHLLFVVSCQEPSATYNARSVALRAATSVLGLQAGRSEYVWSSTDMQERETGDPRENPPTSGIVRHDSTCENPGATAPGIELGSSRWEASSLTTKPPRLHGPVKYENAFSSRQQPMAIGKLLLGAYSIEIYGRAVADGAASGGRTRNAISCYAMTWPSFAKSPPRCLIGALIASTPTRRDDVEAYPRLADTHRRSPEVLVPTNVAPLPPTYLFREGWRDARADSDAELEDCTLT
ncbi:hypothetical protein PR048_002233 [Dryococelus australis]|uniref:Uncharacterized protein n=1 Tax=Dryococelus australis TaxID=614101 RepID=A0ABQ9IKC0_9NEOP|nr:hypothetical protein PR048_002233 [Dryococelus australis]